MQVRIKSLENHANESKACKMRQNRHTEIKRYAVLLDMKTYKIERKYLVDRTKMDRINEFRSTGKKWSTKPGIFQAISGHISVDRFKTVDWNQCQFVIIANFHCKNTHLNRFKTAWKSSIKQECISTSKIMQLLWEIGMWFIPPTSPCLMPESEGFTGH